MRPSTILALALLLSACSGANTVPTEEEPRCLADNGDPQCETLAYVFNEKCGHIRPFVCEDAMDWVSRIEDLTPDQCDERLSDCVFFATHINGTLDECVVTLNRCGGNGGFYDPVFHKYEPASASATNGTAEDF